MCRSWSPPDDVEGLKEAAVLALFGDGPDGPDVLLMQRSEDMRSHAGQPSFPGGRIDPTDDGPVGAALRESQEETGLDPDGVDVLGVLPELWIPPSGNVVTPVVAWWREPSEVRAVSPAEVEAVARVPIADLVDPANRVTVRHPIGLESPAFRVADMLVWGFTAGVLDWLLTHRRLEPAVGPQRCRAGSDSAGLMDALDIVLIAACLGFGYSGYRQGFVVGVLSFAGFLGGGALGAKYAAALHHHFHVGLNPALFGLLVVLIGAVVGQVIMTVVAAMLRREMRWRPLRTLDSVGGGLVSAVAVLLVAWLVGTALAHSSPRGVSREVRHSGVLRAVDGVMPSDARTWFGSFRRCPHCALPTGCPNFPP